MAVSTLLKHATLLGKSAKQQHNLAVILALAVADAVLTRHMRLRLRLGNLLSGRHYLADCCSHSSTGGWYVAALVAAVAPTEHICTGIYLAHLYLTKV